MDPGDPPGGDMELAVTIDRIRRGAIRRGALLGALILVSTGCGGDDTAEAGPDGDETEVTADGASADPGEGDPGDEDDDGANGIPADVTEEEGMATMRPPDDTVPDCVSIEQLEPGASLTFPTDDAGMLDAGPGPVRVEFVGCSNTFEANLVYDAFHGQDTSPTITEVTMGGSMGDWGAFSFEEMFWTPGEWTVVVYEEDAATGERQEYDQVTFSID